MATTQTKVWTATSGTVTRTHKSNTSLKHGSGNNKRLYVDLIGDYNYRSWLKFENDWASVGRIVRAILVCYTDDGLGIADIPADSDLPSVRIRRLTSPFTEGNNVDETFDSSDYTAPSQTTTGETTSRMTNESNGINRIDITKIVNAWAPTGVKRSDGSTGSAAANHGLALIGFTNIDAKRAWSGWSEDAADSSMRPFIELTYEYGATAPDAPAEVSPTGTVASIEAFEGTFTDIRNTDTLRRSQVQVYGPAQAATIATDDFVTDANHGLANGAVIYFTSLTGGVGLTTFTAYYVRARTTNTFKVATANTDATIVNITDAYEAATWRTKVYDKTQAESNAAITAAVFSHIPENLHLVRNVTYGWRARVYDQEGQAGAWSSLTSVAVTNTNPDTPVLAPHGKTYATLDGVQFKGGTFSDPDAGDRLLAYQVQLSAYPEGDGHWDDGESILWDTGKRFVKYGDTDWSTPYGGMDLAAGTYYARARVWDNHQGLSSFDYATITLSANFIAEPNDSVNSIQMRPRAPWRILVKEMKFNTVGGNITGDASTNLLTSASAHSLRAGRKVRFSAITGGTGLVKGQDYYVISSGLTTTAFKVSETYGGSEVNFTTAVTAGTLTAVTTRGPGNVVAVLEDAFNVGASLLYNSPGEAHWTLGIAHPQLSVIEPRQTHYAIEFRQGDGWREVFQGLIVDFDASDTDIIFYGLDYLGLLDFTVDEHYDPANIDKAHDKGGSKYVNQTITAIVTDQLKRAREPVNSIVGFISTGSIATMDEQITVYSTYAATLPFTVSLLDSHRAGSGKMTRLWVRKTAAGGYEWVVTDDPGIERDNLRLRYGELVQGYRVVPFKEFATRVNAIGRDKNGVKVRYVSQQAPVLDENVWGRWMLPKFIDGVADANDMARRTRQASLSASKLGKQVALGLRSGVLQPRDGYDLMDQFPVDIEHGSVSTSAFGSGYWVAVGITWQALQRGDLNTTLTLRPREDGTAPSADLLTLQEISAQAEWQIGWQPPAALPVVSRYWLDQNTGKVYIRTGGALLFTGITGTI